MRQNLTSKHEPLASTKVLKKILEKEKGKFDKDASDTPDFKIEANHYKSLQNESIVY